MGFRLKIKNAPSGSKYWWADYRAYTVYSGWLDINAEWYCTYGAYGATDLRILIADSNWNYVHQQYNLGPIADDKSYVYDCATGILSEEVPEVPTISEFGIASFSKA